MKFAHLILFIVAMLSQVSCYYDTEDEIYPDTGCDLVGVTYSGQIKSIIEQNCYSCHDAGSNFGNVTLEGYLNLKTYAANGFLLGVIRHESGYSPMPNNAPKLLECELQKIEKWVQDGAPDN